MRWFLDLLLSLFQPAPAPQPVPPSTPPDDWQAELLRLHNAERASRGLSPLMWNAKLQASCQGWANHMAATGRMVHSSVGSVINQAGYSWSRCGENIAWGYADPAAVVRGWLNSPGHRANILGNYRHVAICFAHGDRGIYWCAQFASPSVRAFAGMVDYPQLSGPLSP